MVQLLFLRNYESGVFAKGPATLIVKVSVLFLQSTASLDFSCNQGYVGSGLGDLQNIFTS